MCRQKDNLIEQNNMLEFGQKLKKKREGMGLSLEEVSKKIKVSLPYLQALECGNMSELPDVYMKMFLKTYAKFLHVSVVPVSHPKKVSITLDELDDKADEICSQVDFLIEDINEDEDAVDRAKKIISEDFEDYSRISISMPDDNQENVEHPYKLFIAKYFKLIIFIGALLIILSSFGFFTLLIEDEKMSEVESTKIKVITVESDQNNDFSINITDSLQSNSSLLNDSVVFNIQASDSCYVLYYSDDENVKEKMLLPKQKISIKAQYSMEIKVGNIQKLNFTFNGKAIGEQLKTDKSGSAFVKVSAGEGPYFIKKSDKIIKYLKDVYGIQSTDSEKKVQGYTRR